MGIGDGKINLYYENFIYKEDKKLSEFLFNVYEYAKQLEDKGIESRLGDAYIHVFGFGKDN